LPKYPALYEVNTRVLLSRLSAGLRRPATLDDIPDAELDAFARRGFDWIWLLGIWQTGPEGKKIAFAERDWGTGCGESDVCGACFAVVRYGVHADFGGNPALDRLRKRLHARGLRLMLDFVPNHTARDHPWVREHPEYYVRGTEADLAREPRNYCRVESARGAVVLAHGRDPNFPGRTDTLQLNYAEPSLQEAMTAELRRISGMCDGLRCDMAMLLLPEVFERTWRLRPEPFWPRVIAQARAAHPDLLFLAEVYWDLEWTLQQQGFDYTYDKRLYDRLRAGCAGPVRDHLRGDPEFQRRSVRFLENHDEPRAAAVFAPEVHSAAAVITYLSPGLRFFHHGQLEGSQARIPLQLAGGPAEPGVPALRTFYDTLLACLRDPAVRDGEWRLLDPVPAWEGNPTWGNFVAWSWEKDGRCLLMAVNYAPHRGQCYVSLPFASPRSRQVRLRDRLGPAVYDRDAAGLVSPGLYLDMPAWGAHVFELEPEAAALFTEAPRAQRRCRPPAFSASTYFRGGRRGF
jgi:hypothetical protein